MEFVGFKQCMEFLIGYGLFITTFISDCHVSIASHMKEVLKNIVHYFDIWHLKKSKLIYRYTILHGQRFRHLFRFISHLLIFQNKWLKDFMTCKL